MAWPERTYWATVKEYFTFTKEEMNRLLISIFFMALIVSFNDWGPAKNFNFFYGLRNFISALLVSALSLLVYTSGQRLFAIVRGYRAEYEFLTVGGHEIPKLHIGIIIGMLLMLLSGGKLWFVAFGGVVLHHLAAHRLGWFRYQLSYKDWALVALMGPLSSMFLALVFKSLTNISFLQDNALIPTVVLLNVILAIESMIPLPGLDGGRIFFGSRMLWAFGLAFIIGASALLFFMGAIASIIAALILAVIVWFTWIIFVEKALK